MFTLPELPFDPNNFSDFCSAETFSYHHGKHHAGYVKKLNAAIEGTELAEKSLEEVISETREENPGVFNNAAQHFNHSFFWNGLSESVQNPDGDLAAAIDSSFGSLEAFKEQFTDVAGKLFGSGWAWLVQNADGSLEILPYKDANTPAGTNKKPLLTLDVWEHAYYIDHRNDRAGFIAKFWEHVNWEFVAKQLVA